MRHVRLVMIVCLAVAAAIYSWCRFRILDLQEPSVRAQNASVHNREALPPLSVNQVGFGKNPPFSGMGIQARWNYSDLVCTGTATNPQRTGQVKRIGGTDRDQLASLVTIQNCFKGENPGTPIRVIGYDVVALRETYEGIVYSGPPLGFVELARNLLFLRKTRDPHIWDVTVPVYQTCIPLAQVHPAYVFDGSVNSVRNAVATEMEAAIASTPRNSVDYLRYVIDVLGETKGLSQLKQLSQTANKDLRRQIALTLLWHGDQDGEREALSLLHDSSAVSWQRGNAARALRNATSLRARRALEQIVNQPAPDEVRNAARESLMLIGR